MVPIQAAGLMLHCFKTDRILFLRRGPGSDFAGCWHFPGGRLEIGETPEQAAERETMEEAGPCPHGNPELWHNALNDDPTDYETPVHYTTFRAMVAAEFCPVLNYENTAWCWATADGPPLPLHPGCESALRKITGETITEETDDLQAMTIWNRDHSEKVSRAFDAVTKLADRMTAAK
jgi:8-oxo-dGTP pyrophosphatase MutT (NUDIX family)